MSQHRYPVSLNPQQRMELEQLIRTGSSPAHRQIAARVLLKADQNQSGGRERDQQIADALQISRHTVIRIKARFVQQNLSHALTASYPTERPAHRKLDGAAQAQLVTVACSQAPDGRQRWTLQLLADRLVQLGIVEQISKETVRQVLKKTN